MRHFILVETLTLIMYVGVGQKFPVKCYNAKGILQIKCFPWHIPMASSPGPFFFAERTGVVYLDMLRTYLFPRPQYGPKNLIWQQDSRDRSNDIFSDRCIGIHRPDDKDL